MLAKVRPYAAPVNLAGRGGGAAERPPPALATDPETGAQQNAAQLLGAIAAAPLHGDLLEAVAHGEVDLTAAYAGRVDLARAPFDVAAAEALLLPLEPLLSETERLAIVPDGVLHLLPFEALVARRPFAGGAAAAYLETRYAIDRFEIAYLPSAQFLGARTRAGQRAGPTERILAVSRDAPGGDREIGAIRDAWPPRLLTALTGDSATETEVIARAARYAALHFAVHARADDRDPLASHLRLASDAANDGYLHLNEVAAQHLRARLVVLSACETVSGRLCAGEGLMGLARAFLAGGAHAVVASQWPVGSEAAAMMGAFYQRLAAGWAPAAALRSAKLLLRSDPATAHPFYWAGFVLITGG